MQDYTPRIIEAQLSAALANVPAIFLEGAKGVGKTAAAKRFAKTILELDDVTVREALENDLNALAKMTPPVLIDEWQQVPAVWNKIRRLVDAGAPNGSFILTGSVSKTDYNLHSGAGRILSLQMRPFALSERFHGVVKKHISLAALLEQSVPFSASMSGSVAISYPDYVREITRSGLPGVRNTNTAYVQKIVSGYIQYALTRDFDAQGINVRRPAILKRWLKAYAAAVATDAGYSEILDASTPGESNKPSRTTTVSYRDALERLWLIDELGAWTDGGNWFSRLKTSPRHYLSDPALVCSLLGITGNALLTGGVKSIFDAPNKTFAGRLFESLVVQTMHTCAIAADASMHYLRTQKGDHEVDIIIQKGNRIVAFEVKLSPTVNDTDVRHLVWLKKQLGDTLADAAIITTGPTCYRRKNDGIGVIPAAMLAP